MKAIITGTTGMVGKGVLLECLDDPRVESVLVVNRKSLGMEHPKLKEILVKDFMKLKSAQSKLKGYDTCFFCAGTSSIGKNEDVFSKITYDITVNFAFTFLEVNPGSTICYVTGTGTDSTEKGNTMWARVKGKTENALLNMGFKAAFMFRPGYIQPLRGIRSNTGWYDYLYLVFKPIYLILKHFPSTATNTTNMGKAMINLAIKGNGPAILHSKEINSEAN